MSNQDIWGPPEGWIITVRTEPLGGGPRALEVWGAWTQDEMAGLDLIREARVVDEVIETRLVSAETLAGMNVPPEEIRRIGALPKEALP